MADYTFEIAIEPLKNNSTIQTVLDIDALAAPAKAALAGYVAALGLPASETQHLTWENVGVAVLLQSLNLVYYLPSLGSQTPAPDLRRSSTLQTRVVEMQTLESKFPKCQLLIFSKNAGEANWVWRNSETIQNSGNRVNTLKLVPYLSQGEIFAPGRRTQIGIQFIADSVSRVTLPAATDRLTLTASVHLDINPLGTDLKKNDQVDESEVGNLQLRLATLETLIQPFGAATADVAGTTGLVAGAAAGQGDFLVRGDRTWQDPAEFVSSTREQTIEGDKTFSRLASFLGGVVVSGVGSLVTFSQRTAATLFSASGGSYLSLSASDAPSNLRVVDLEFNRLGILTLRRISDAYNIVVANVFRVDTLGNFQLFGFTNLGDNVAIKVKRLEGITPSTQGGLTQVVHGLNVGKIIGCQLIVNFADSQIFGSPYINVPGFEVSWQFNFTHLLLYAKSGNSASVLSKPFSALVFYTN